MKLTHEIPRSHQLETVACAVYSTWMFHASTPSEFYKNLGAERKKAIEQCVDRIRALDDVKE